MTINDFDTYRDPEPEGRRRRGGKGGKRRRRPTDWLGDSGGRGERALVPDVEFTSYYGHNIVKPVPWSHSIPTYLFFGGLAGGSQLLATGAHLTGNVKLRRATRLTSLFALAMSGATLVEDLGKRLRAVNMLRTLKVTSPMSVGSWILSGYAVGAGSLGALELANIVKLPIPGNIQKVIDLVETPLSLEGAFFSPPLAAYTAVLLSGTATPLWHESYHELPFVFVSSASAAGGGAAMMMVPVQDARPARLFAVIGSCVDVTMMQLMQRRLGFVGEPLHHGTPGKLDKAALALNIAGVVGTVTVGRKWRVGAVMSGLAFVAGSVATRFAVFEAGMETARDPRYTVIPQKERLAKRRAEGKLDDSITTIS